VQLSNFTGPIIISPQSGGIPSSLAYSPGDVSNAAAEANSLNLQLESNNYSLNTNNYTKTDAFLDTNDLRALAVLRGKESAPQQLRYALAWALTALFEERKENCLRLRKEHFDADNELRHLATDASAGQIQSLLEKTQVAESWLQNIEIRLQAAELARN